MFTRPDIASNWANCTDDRCSIGAYCVFFGDSLASSKQKVVAQSSANTEYRALALASFEIIWLQSLLQELHITLPHTAVLLCDNLSVKHFSANPIQNAHMKHIELD